MVKQTAGRDALHDFAPKFAELNDDVLFGEVWSREGQLPLKLRSIVTITALISKGITDSSLTYHLTTAKQNGVTKTEMAEILTHLAFYAGWPNAWAAFRQAKEVYADDGADEVVKEFVSGEITLNVNDLLPADLAALLGQKQDTDKVVYGSDSDEAPYTAIGFRAKKAGGTYKYIWLYKVKFAIPDENYTTKGDSIEFTTPEIVGQFIKRSDGLWKAEHVAEPTNSVATAWFTSVREPNNVGG